MADEIGVTAASFGEMFSPNRIYVCPFFQRTYAWKQADLKPFIDDLFALREDDTSEHYLGAVVLRRDQSEPAGALRPELWDVIDGQQRLFTGFLTILALAEALHAAGVDCGDVNVAKQARGVVEQYLILPETWKASRYPKIRPTADDFSQFRQVLHTAIRRTTTPTFPDAHLAFNQDFIPDSGPENGLLVKAHNSIPDILRGKLGDDIHDPGTIEKILDLFTERMKLIEVVVPDGSDPYKIFDNLNTRGERLKYHELVKVSVFKRFTPNDTVAARALSTGDWTRLTSALAPDVFEKFLFPYALCHSSAAQKKTLTPALERQWKGKEPDEIVADMRRYAVPYLLLTDPEYVIQSHVSNPALAERLRAMRDSKPPSSALPYLLLVLLQAMEDDTYADSAARIFWEMESFLVRRLYKGIEPTGLHALFKILWAWTDESGNITGQQPGGLTAALAKNRTVISVSDSDFVKCIETEGVYTRRITSFVVGEFERAHSGDINEVAVRSLTLEHIAPKEIKGTKWESIFTDAQEYAGLVHTWGNLLPLSGKGDAGNSAAGQSTWLAKRRLYKKSIFQTPRDLENVAAWDAAAIRARNTALATWALERWPISAPTKLPKSAKAIWNAPRLTAT